MRYAALHITTHQSVEREAKTWLGLACCSPSHKQLQWLKAETRKRREMVSLFFLSFSLSLSFFFFPSKKTFVVKKYVIYFSRIYVSYSLLECVFLSRTQVESLLEEIKVLWFFCLLCPSLSYALPIPQNCRISVLTEPL